VSALALGLAAAGGNCRAALRTADGSLLELESTGRADAALVTQRLLARAGRRAADLTELRVDVGPGSYTGLRVALTFARVLAAFGGVPLLAVTHFELLAAVAWRAGLVAAGQAVRPLLDARRGRVHQARVVLRDTVHLDGEPAALPLERLGAALAPGELLLAEPALAARLGVTAAPLPEVSGRDLFDPRLAPRPRAPEDVEPLYLMGSYAE
jgi:tRNA threonylcarbamoyladenosine biosynthesis protein TsaB